MGLRKGQRNAIFRAVEDAGLSPEEFDWDLGADESTLRHRPSGAYFVFGGVAGDYVSCYLAGEGPVEERTGLSQYRLTQQVQFWLAHLKLDIDTPDLWAQLQGEAELLGAVFDEATENTPLTSAEQEEITGQLRELRDYVSRTYSLSEAQTRLLEEKLDYLAAATSRVGRKDWLLMAAGLMLSYVLGAALPPEAARDILGTLLTSIGHILGGGPLGLPGG
ncbi:MAG: hypothetical protein WA484_04565 [Solirubrobacteraceae bacterium]